MNRDSTHTETKPGYKKTKLGWIPEDWKEKKLESIVTDFDLGGNYSNDQKNDGLPLIKMGNLSRGKINLDKIEYVNIEDEIDEEDILQYGDLLFNTRNSLDLVGKVAVWRSEIDKALYNSNLLKMSFDSTHVYSSFFMNYLFNSFRVLMRLRAIATGTTSVAAIYNKDVMKLKLPLPPKKEQKIIIKILSTWDEAISKTEKLIQAKKRHKKGLMQRLLSGKVRFPEFDGEEWVEVKLKRFFKSFSVKNKDNEDLPILSCSKVHGITLQSNIFNKRVASKDIQRYKVIEKDDLIYDPMLLWDASIGFLKEEDRGVISPAYNTFKFKENSGYRPFFEYLFDTHYMRYNYKAISQGTNRRRRKAPAEAFLKIDIRAPKSIEEQKRIAEVMGMLQNEIDLLNKEVELLQRQKKGLMQKLLTGKVRVK